jgi:AraC family L-rhamnose operon transcriptional activator RhaR
VEVQRARTLFERRGLPIAIVNIELPAGPIVEHAHDFLVVELIVAGAGRHQTSSGSAPVSPGSVVVVRPGVVHGYDVPERLGLLNLCIQPMLLHSELAWVLDFPHLALTLLGAGESQGLIAEDRFDNVVRLLKLTEARISTRPSPVLLGLASAVLSELADVEFSPTAVPLDLSISQLVRDGMLLLANEPAADWTVPGLARRLSTSESSLYRQFRSQTGASPLAWLTQFRAEQAAKLLSSTDLPIGAIGQQVGWPDPNYFSRRFREIYSVSPSEHRLRFRGVRRP